MQLDHLCEQKMCVNPWHLEPVTKRENQLRRTRQRTHCTRGHAYADHAFYTGDIRRCRECSRADQRAYNERRRST